MSAPFQCWQEPDGSLWVSAGHAIGIHSATTVEYSTAGGAAVGVTTPAGRGAVAAVTPPAGQRLIGGNGRHWRISGGPADPDFPTGVYRPLEPGVWDTPDYGAASLTQAGDGSLSLHDGTGEVATAPSTGTHTGTRSAGTFVQQDYQLESTVGNIKTFRGLTDATVVVILDTSSGVSSVEKSGDQIALRSADDEASINGVYDAGTQAEIDYNGGSSWTYTLSGGSLSGTMTATAYGKTTYNGGSDFTFAAAFEGDITGRGAVVAVDAGTAQAGEYAWTGWQELTSVDDAAWTITIDGTGEASLDDGTDVVAIRAADASKLYDFSGPYVVTSYGRAEYGVESPETTGVPSAGTVEEQAFVLASTVGAIETHNGTVDPRQYIELDTGTGDAILYDGSGAIAERLAGSTADIDGSYASTDYGAATYNAEAAFTFDVATADVAAAFSVSVAAQGKPAQAGYAYVVLAVDSVTDELEGISGPFFAAALPANTSTAKSFPIAKSDGAGAVDQIQIGPIIWRA